MSALSFELFGHDISASRALSGVGRVAGHTGKNIAGVATVSGLLAVKFGAMAATAANVGQALAQAAPAAGLLAPAALTGAQAMFALKLAGDAVTASMAKFKPQLDSLKTAAGAGITPGLDKGMRSLMTNLPVLRQGLRDTGKAFGDLAQLGGAVFSGPAFRGDLKTIMASNTVAIRNFGIAGISMARSLIDVAVAASPAWRGVSKLAQSYASSAQQWIASKRASGELQAMIERGVDRVGQLFRIVGNIGGAILNVFKAINAGSGDLDVLSRVETMTGWLKQFTAAGGWAATSISNFYTKVRQGATAALSYIKEGGSAFIAAFQNKDVTSDGWVGALEKAGVAARTVSDKIRSDLIPAVKMGGSAFVGAFMNKDVTSDGWVGIVERMGVSFRQLVDFARRDLLPTLLDVGKFLFTQVLPPVMDIANAVRGVFLHAFSAAFSVIRTTVLPALQPLARILRDDVVPLVRQVAQFFSEHLIPAAQKLAENALKPLRGAFDSIRSAIDQNRPQLQALFNIIKTVAGFIVEHLAPILGTILGAAFRLLGQEISIAITIIGGLVRGITGIVHAVQTVIGWFGRFASAAGSAVGAVGRWFQQLPGRVAGAVGSLGRTLYGAGGAALRGLKNGAVTAWGAVGGWLRGIPRGIVTQVGNLGRILYNAGRAVLSGLWDGLKSKWEDVKHWVGSIGSWIKGLKGPLDYDRRLLIPAGHAIMGGLDEGLRKGWAGPAGFLGGLGAEIAGPSVGLAGGSLAGTARAAGRGGDTYVFNIAGSVLTERRLGEVARDAIERGKRPNAGKTGLTG